jgi:hypothetical protein
VYIGSLFSSFLPPFVVICVLDSSHSYWGEIDLHCHFDLHFLYCHVCWIVLHMILKVHILSFLPTAPLMKGLGFVPESLPKSVQLLSSLSAYFEFTLSNMLQLSALPDPVKDLDYPTSSILY